MSYQPKKQTKPWNRSVANARQEIAFILEDSPSLRREVAEMLKISYKYAREKAALETGLAIMTFPEECPWKIKDIL